jgi:hypothetical protein
MDELINQITSRTGISQDQATQAVNMVISFAKDKLPEPFGSQLEGMMGGGSAPGVAGLQEQLGNLGGMFGKNQ